MLGVDVFLFAGFVFLLSVLVFLIQGANISLFSFLTSFEGKLLQFVMQLIDVPASVAQTSEIVSIPVFSTL